MINHKNLHLYVYSDSTAFPRAYIQQLEQTWPFILKDKIEMKAGVRVYLCMRGLGGASINEISRIFNRDSGYYSPPGEYSDSIAIFNIGIVDAAPQPFTFPLRKLNELECMRPLWKILRIVLVRYRPVLQRIYSYRTTNPRGFEVKFTAMIQKAKSMGMTPISIDIPMPPLAIEARSPGLRDSIQQYNLLKKECGAARNLCMQWVDEKFLMDDGHHFNVEGHKMLADFLYDIINDILLDHKNF